MTYEEFLNVLGGMAKTDRRDYRGALKPSQPALVLEYETGGASGGNCYGDDARTYVVSTVPNFDELDEALLKVCPNASFLQVKRLYATVIEDGTSWTSNDYYGNYTDYSTKIVEVRKLYDALVEMQLLEGEPCKS